ncbi:MAG: roadblock/LC7 domain-containing protein [Deltaproteobacteria bacterium]|nr:MAG: roadblock/LC7 domain-containing protein [Deltaproteobacteria bacterium]
MAEAIRTATDAPFGETLAAWVRRTPGAIGAVLSDEDGNAVDFAHLPDRVSELDIQIFGAQLCFATRTYSRWSLRNGMGPRPLLLVECTRRIVLCQMPADGFFASGLLERPAGLGHALAAWHVAVEAMRRLLE